MPLRRYKRETPRGRVGVPEEAEQLEKDAIQESIQAGATPEGMMVVRAAVVGAEECHLCGCRARVVVDLENDFPLRYECLDCGEGEEHTMRLLPCTRCRTFATTSDGAAYLFGKAAPIAFPFRYTCSKCGTLHSLTAFDWNAIPLLGPDAFRKHLPAPADRDHGAGSVRQRFVRTITDQSHLPPEQRLGRLIQPPPPKKPFKVPFEKVPLSQARSSTPKAR